MKPIVIKFLCPFCPAFAPGDVIADSKDGSISHSMPICKRFNAIDMDVEDSMSNFLADCRKKMSGRAPS